MTPINALFFLSFFLFSVFKSVILFVPFSFLSLNNSFFRLFVIQFLGFTFPLMN